MNALSEAKFRARDSIAAFENDCSLPLDGASCLKMQNLLIQFADELLDASESDGIELQADEFDDLLASIEYFQDRVLETQPA